MKKQVRFWWDMQDLNNIGWYAIVEHIDQNNIEVYSDSVKTDFPVNIYDYNLTERDEVQSVLQDFFPDYEIIQVNT